MGFSTSADDIARDLAILRSDFDRSRSLQSKSYTESDNPYFDFLRARDGFFDKPIVETAFLRTDSSQTILNNDVTGVNWSSVIDNSGIISVSTSVNSSRIYWKPVAANQIQLMWLIGWANWDANSSGIRQILQSNFRRDDTQISGIILAEGPAVGSNQSFSFPRKLDSSFYYSVLEVYQNTGGNLGLSQTRFSVLRVT